MRVPKLEALRSPRWVLAASLLFTMVLATLANLTIELWQLGDSDAPSSLGNHQTLFWLGTLVIWMFVLLVLAVVGRLWVTASLVAIAAVVIGFANHEKLVLRLEPLYPSDLAMAGEVDFLGQMVGVQVIFYLAAGVVLAIGAALVCGRLAEKVFPRIRRRTHPRLATGLVVARVCAVAVIIPMLVYITNFNAPGNRFRTAYEENGANWKPWNQSRNYRENGFVGGMLFNTYVPGMTVPPDYSAATMHSLVEKYADSAATINQRREGRDEVNVVMVLAEAFTDPMRLESVEVAEDPIPYTRSLMRRTTSGNMLANQFGGGTANVEFSALTGMSMALLQPQMTTPYQMLVPEYESFPSLVGYLDSLGYRTAAIHPFKPSFYRRSEVYPILGFDTVKFEDQMVHQQRLEDNDYISDAAAFKEVSDEIDKEADPVFVNLVTMQNHYPMAGKYANPIEVTGVDDPEARANAEAYARGLRYSDDALQRFIASLERSTEKTVLVLYGDHLPSFWPPAVRVANGARRVHETPFFVYANFGKQEARRLPTTSPMYFANFLLAKADVPLPPYYALLGELQREIPALEHRMVIGPNNQKIPPGEMPARARELLHDYRLVQYDLSVGHRYSQDAMFYPAQ